MGFFEDAKPKRGTLPPEVLAMKQKMIADMEAKFRGKVEKVAVRYGKLPVEIRASIAKRAGVPNKPLDELTRGERNQLKDEARKLLNVLHDAWELLVESTAWQEKI